MGQKEAWSASCSEGCGQQGGGVKKLICAREIYNMLLIWNKNIQGIWLDQGIPLWQFYYVCGRNDVHSCDDKPLASICELMMTYTL